jgi:Carbohydrate esterase, sialic acid-specific acetylesterase
LNPSPLCVMAKSLLTLAAVLITFVGAAQTNLPSPLQINLAAPLDFQIVQRPSRAGARLTVTGTVALPDADAAAPPDKLEARLAGKSASGELPGEWQSLPFDARVAAFSGQLTVSAGGWYRLEVRATRRGATVAAAAVEHVGVGEVFVVGGQSNSANYGEERQTNHTGFVAVFDGRAWRLAGDPEPGATGKGGSFMPVFGDAMVGKFRVPIGLVPVGIGSTSVREWLPAGIRFTNLTTVTRNVVAVGPGEWEASGKIFTNFTARLRQLGPHGFRAVLWHQGESDANQAEPARTLPGNLYRQFLAELIRDSHREIGWDAPWFVAQVSYHRPGDVGSPDIRAAQKTLWDDGVALEGPDTDTLTGDMREKEGKGIHLSAKGLREHGRVWAAKVGPWLEAQLGQPAP